MLDRDASLPTGFHDEACAVGAHASKMGNTVCGVDWESTPVAHVLASRCWKPVSKADPTRLSELPCSGTLPSG